MKLEDIANRLHEFEQYFSESGLREKLEKGAKTIGATVLYPVLLLWDLLRSGEVGLKEKAMIVGALGYFILPLDLIPDALVGLGYTDDAMALTAVITALAACITDDIQNEAKQQLHQWLGDFDEASIEAITRIIRSANEFINKKKR